MTKPRSETPIFDQLAAERGVDFYAGRLLPLEEIARRREQEAAQPHDEPEDAATR